MTLCNVKGVILSDKPAASYRQLCSSLQPDSEPSHLLAYIQKGQLFSLKKFW